MPPPPTTPQRPDADDASDVPALLRPQASEPPGGRRSRNEGGYQETTLTPETADDDREAAGNCALLHRATDQASEPAGETAEASPARRERPRG